MRRSVRLPRRDLLKIAFGAAAVGVLGACAPAAPAQPTSAPPAAKPTEAPKPAAAPATSTPVTVAAPAAQAAPTQAAAAPTLVAQAAPAKPSGSVPKNAFTLAVRTDPPSIDPGVAADLPGRMAVIQAYEPLLRYEGKPPKVVPHLAESITAADGGKTYTVKLRPGVKFHDGSEVDADAVVYSIDRVLNMKKGAAGAFSALIKPGDTRALDKQTVQFNLTGPSAIFPATLPFLFIVNPKVINANKQASGAYGANGDYGEQYLQTVDAGTGPYRLKGRTPNAQIDFEAFPDYWRGWKDQQYGTFTYKIVPEPPTAGLLLRQGQVDGIYEFYAANIFDDLASDPNVKVHSDLGVKPLYIYMNNQKAPTDNPKFRQAVAYAFDYKQAIEGIMATQPETARLPGPLPQTVWSANDKNPYDTNIEKAKSLMQEAGVKAGEVTLEFGASGGPADIRTKVALLMQANLSQIGVNVEISQNTWADMLQQMSKADTTKHMYGVYLSYDYGDPDALLFPGWHSSSQGTWSGSQWYKNPKVDEMIEKGRTTVGDDQRLPIYKEIQQTILNDSPAVFVFNEPIRVALNKNVGGYNYIIGVYNYAVYDFLKQG